jgi:hypothetical protein
VPVGHQETEERSNFDIFVIDGEKRAANNPLSHFIHREIITYVKKNPQRRKPK